jgi:hypothetical protein
LKKPVKISNFKLYFNRFKDWFLVMAKICPWFFGFEGGIITIRPRNRELSHTGSFRDIRIRPWLGCSFNISMHIKLAFAAV